MQMTNDNATSITFDQAFQSFYVVLEETRTIIPNAPSSTSSSKSESERGLDDSEKHERLAQNLSQLHEYLGNLQSTSSKDGNDDVRNAISEDCQRKLLDLSITVFSHVTNSPLSSTSKQGNNGGSEEGTYMFMESPPANVPDGNQSAIAYITELTILLHSTIKPNNQDSSSFSSKSNIKVNQIIEAYASYQRRILRQRSKPSIAYLSELRRSGTLQDLYNSMQDDEDDYDDEDAIHHEDEEVIEKRSHIRKQPHSQTITAILGEASQLLQPLGVWKSSLPMIMNNENYNNIQNHHELMPKFLHDLCDSSLTILNEEAQILSSFIIKWLDIDNDLNTWIDRSIAYHKNEDALSSSDLLDGVDVGSLERICNELSFLCQVLSRYNSFISTLLPSTSISPPLSSSLKDSKSSLKLYCTTIQTLLSKLCGNYATLEDYFACVSLLKAKAIASPVPIITGEKVYVPSIVEDAYYISQRALERANETMSQHAIITVMHRIEEMWECSGAGIVGGGNKKGVHQVLIEGGAMLDVTEAEEMGDLMIEAENEEKMARLTKQQQILVQKQKQQQQIQQNQGGSSFMFASAFLDAIAQDMGETDNITSQKIQPPKPIKKNKKMNAEGHLLSQICLMNGISSASAACSALSSLLDSFLPQHANGTDNAFGGHDKLLKLSQENLLAHSKNYAHLLSEKTRQVLIQWCGPTEFADLLPIDRIQTYIDEQNYCINDNISLRREEEKVEEAIVQTILNGRFTREALKGGRCEGAVLIEIVKTLATMISEEIILRNLLQSRHIRFTDWGALLLSTQVRIIQNMLCSFILDNEANVNANAGSETDHATSSSSMVKSAPFAGSMSNTAPILERMERLSQAVTILQLERPSDWTTFRYDYERDSIKNGFDDPKEDKKKSVLSREEVQRIMSLRVDFSEEAVTRACFCSN